MRLAYLAPLLLLAGCASGSSHDSDVQVTACSRTSFTGPVATLQITNTGSDPLDYFVTVTFHAADGSSGEGFSGDVSVPAGGSQTAEVHAVGGRGPMPTSCDVSEVSAS